MLVGRVDQAIEIVYNNINPRINLFMNTFLFEKHPCLHVYRTSIYVLHSVSKND